MSIEAATFINKDELLVEWVKKHPMLFDHSHAGYRQRELREKIWHDIADKLDYRQKEATERWRSLRDKYCKIWRRSLTNPGVERDWYLFNKMSFIQPHLRPKLHHSASSGTSPCNMSNAVVQQIPQEITETDVKMPISQLVLRHSAFSTTPTGSGYFSDSSESSETMPPLQKRPKRSVLIQQSTTPASSETNAEFISCIPEILKLLKEKQSTAQPSTTVEASLDEDELFMSSMTTALKRMEPKQKFEIKMGIMKLMYKADFDQNNMSNIEIPVVSSNN